jgi:hypothetical protein
MEGPGVPLSSCSADDLGSKGAPFSTAPAVVLTLLAGGARVPDDPDQTNAQNRPGPARRSQPGRDASAEDCYRNVCGTRPASCRGTPERAGEAATINQQQRKRVNLKALADEIGPSLLQRFTTTRDAWSLSFNQGADKASEICSALAGLTGSLVGQYETLASQKFADLA